MSCECDYEPAKLSSFGERRARKQHRCDDCGGVIQPGERYKWGKWLYEDEWWGHKRCADCQFIMCELDSLIECWCNVWGGFDERIEQELCDNWEQRAQIRKIVLMFNAAAEARGGHPIHSIWLEDDES